MRGALGSLKSPAIALLCMPDLTVRATVTQLGNLRAMDPGVQLVALNPQKQGAHTYHNGQKKENND